MCGIAGFLDFAGRPLEVDALLAMRDSMAHRGPNDQGIYTEPGLGLAHRRLSIIDLSPAGHQPMSNEDGTLWVVFNGEIYNFEPLRAELMSKGHVFRSGTDKKAFHAVGWSSGVSSLGSFERTGSEGTNVLDVETTTLDDDLA